LDLIATAKSHADGKACHDVLAELPQLGTLAISGVPDRDKAVQC